MNRHRERKTPRRLNCAAKLLASQPFPRGPQNPNTHCILANRLAKSSVTINRIAQVRRSHGKHENKRCRFGSGSKPGLNQREGQKDEKINPGCCKTLPKSCVFHGADKIRGDFRICKGCPARRTFDQRSAMQCQFCATSIGSNSNQQSSTIDGREALIFGLSLLVFIDSSA